MLVLVNGKVKKDTMKDDLFELFNSFDSDLNGQNGDEFTSNECLERGFRCDLDMFINDVLNELYIDEPMAVVRVAEKIEKSSCQYVEHKVLLSDEINGVHIYSVAFIMK